MDNSKATKKRFTVLKLAGIAVAGVLVASCSTSAVSTSNSNPGKKQVAAKTASAEKTNPWQQARERYKKRMEELRAKRKARMEEIKKRRAEQREKRLARIEKLRNANSKKASARKSGSKKTVRSSSKSKKNNVKRAKKNIAKIKSPKGKIRMARAIRARAPWKCLPNRLKSVMNSVAKKYGRLTINSTYRSPRHNRRVGGAKRSWHKKCAAVDFRVHGRHRGLSRYLRNHPYVGGLKRYRSGYYHIDTGPRRSW